MQAQTPEVSSEKATTPRYDTIVIKDAKGQNVPKEVDGGEVVAWSLGHGLAAMDALEEFVDDLAAGNCHQPAHLTQGAADALNLMRRRRAIGWDTDEPTEQPPADWKTAVARAEATTRKVFGEDGPDAMQAIDYMAGLLLASEPTAQPVAWRWKLAYSCWQLEDQQPVTDEPTAIIEPLYTAPPAAQEAAGLVDDMDRALKALNVAVSVYDVELADAARKGLRRQLAALRAKKGGEV